MPIHFGPNGLPRTFAGTFTATMLAGLAIFAGLSLTAQSAAVAQAPAVAPLIRQVFVDPAGPDFVEIENTGSSEAALGDLYLASVPDYYRVVLGEFGGTSASDFLVRFPADVTVAPGASVVVLLDGLASEFRVRYGFAPNFSLVAADEGDSVPMFVLNPGGGTPSASLDPAAGLLVLFYWDGASDLVEDSDIVMWGDASARVDKTGVSVDGPDAAGDPSTYLDDTSAAMQRPATAPASGLALVRIGGEQAEGRNGNGLDGEDETSENLDAAFSALEPAPLLFHSITVKGSVLPGARNPSVAGVNLEFVNESNLVVQIVVTDDQGAYQVTLPAGREFLVILVGPTILTSEETLITDAHNMQDVDFVVDGLLPITGEVVALDRYAQRAIAGLTVALADDGRSVVLEASGFFELPVDRQGEHVVSVRGAGIAPVDTIVDVGPAGAAGVVIEVSAAFAVTGTVTDGQGNPIEGAAVSLVGAAQQAVTDAHGAYVFDFVPPAIDTLRVEAQGFLPFEASVDIRSDIVFDVVLEVPGELLLSVQVTTSDGQPAKGVEVWLAIDGEGDEQLTTTGPDGRAEFSNLLPRNYRLEFRHGGYRPLTIDSVPVTLDTSLAVLLVSSFRQPTVTETGCSCSTVGRSASPRSELIGCVLGLVAIALWRRSR